MQIRCPSCNSVHLVGFELMAGQNVECSCGERFAVGTDTVVAESRRDTGGTGGAAIEEGTLIGRCRIERMIGKGAIGDVYLARHMTLDIPVAVKVLRAHFAFEPEFKKRFYREARTAARLDHPNVVRVLDCGEDEGSLYLVMEYMSRGTVKDMLDRAGEALPAVEVVEMGIAMCRALGAAWNHGIVHRDVKPDNITISENGTYKLSDLGLAREMVSRESGLTVQFTGLGTPHYMAPEQAYDAGTCDVRADIYSLGATLYHAACGRPPFHGKTSTDILRQHARSTCPPPSRVNPRLPVELDEILGAAMMKQPERRYATPPDMLNDLERTRDRMVGQGAGWRWPSYSLPLAGIGAVIGLLGFGAGVLFGPRRDTGDPRVDPPAAANESSRRQDASPRPANSVREGLAVQLVVGSISRDTGQRGIFVELTARARAGTPPLAAGRLVFQGAVYELEPSTTTAGLRFSLPDLPVYPDGGEARLHLADEKGQSFEYNLPIPPEPQGTLRVLPPHLGLRADTIRLRWEPLKSGEDVPRQMDELRVAIGWPPSKGPEHVEMELTASPRSGAVDIPLDAFASVVRAMPRDTALIVRYTAQARRKHANGVTIESVMIREERHRADDSLLRYPLLSEGVRKWLNVVREKGLPKDVKADFSAHMWQQCGSECVGDLLDMVLLDEGGVCYWSAFVLSELAPARSVETALKDRFPNEFSQRRTVLRLRQKTYLHPDDFPDTFRELLRGLGQRHRPDFERPTGVRRSRRIPTPESDVLAPVEPPEDKQGDKP